MSTYTVVKMPDQAFALTGKILVSANDFRSDDSLHFTLTNPTNGVSTGDFYVLRLISVIFFVNFDSKGYFCI